jgi:hypothetical protein
METFKILEFATSQEAWEGINEYFLLSPEDIIKRNGTSSSSLLIAYDTIVKIRKLRVDPEFDFSRTFNYRKQKWNTLVSNYVDLNLLDLVKTEVQKREAKRDSNYNISFLFDNTHISGKGCLLSITFSRRNYADQPTMIVSMRSSEIVKRLNFDFLLVQRIAEYVYGTRTHVGANFYIPNMYTIPEVSAMYHKHRDLKILFEGVGKLTPFQSRTLATIDKFRDIDIEKISYKIHQRAAKVLQGHGEGKPLLARDLQLTK